MIVSLIRTVYFLKLKAENTAVTQAGHEGTFNYGNFNYGNFDYRGTLIIEAIPAATILCSWYA